MKTKTINHGVEEVNCICRNCGFDANGEKKSGGEIARRKARQHAIQKGHSVDVYIETWKTIKPIN